MVKQQQMLCRWMAKNPGKVQRILNNYLHAAAKTYRTSTLISDIILCNQPSFSLTEEEMTSFGEEFTRQKGCFEHFLRPQHNGVW